MRPHRLGQGLEVDDRYWRPNLKAADAKLLKVRRALRLLNREKEADEDTLGDRIAALDSFRGVVHKMARRAPDHQMPAVTNFGVQV